MFQDSNFIVCVPETMVYYIVVYAEIVSSRLRDGLDSVDFDAHNILQKFTIGALNL